MPAEAGVGFTDVGTGFPGTDSAQFTASDFVAWRASFFQRLAAHAARAAASVGCVCGRCGAPALVAFSGKRQFVELFAQPARRGQGRRGGAGPSGAPHASSCEPTAEAAEGGPGVRLQARRPAKVNTGRQLMLPEGWPLPLEGTEVWLMTSTSGAAALSKERRDAPWQQLAARLSQEPWPRPQQPRCLQPAAHQQSPP